MKTCSEWEITEPGSDKAVILKYILNRIKLNPNLMALNYSV